MKNKIIVITGGATGIGLGLAKALAPDNTVISIDRNASKIAALKAALPKVESIQGDVTSNDDMSRAMSTIEKNHGKIDILINNAGKGTTFDFPKNSEQELLSNISMEMDINYIAPIMISKKAMALLNKSSEPAIIMVSSGLAYIPIAMLGTYCASKAAIHFATMSIRHQLAGTKIRVVEVLPPVVDTDLSKGVTMPKMSTEKFAQILISKYNKGENVMDIGQSAGLKTFTRLMPNTAFKTLNKPQK